MLEELIVAGSAQAPQSMPWQPSGSTRAVEDALVLAQTHGVTYPEEVRLVAYASLPVNVYAAYLLPTRVASDEFWEWERFLNRFGELPIRLKPNVLDSDEAIVAVLAHEAYELNMLRVLLPDGYSMSTLTLHNHIAPNINGNLHCQAWDDADARIWGWRANP